LEAVLNLAIREEKEVMCYFVSIKFKLYFMLQEIQQNSEKDTNPFRQRGTGFLSYIPVGKLGERTP